MRQNKLLFESLQLAATRRGGVCLSSPEHFVNSQSLLTWKCAKNHQWTARAINIKRGTWCPTCAFRKPELLHLRTWAINLGGECLVEDGSYKNSITAVLWRCKNGHTWAARWHDIQQGKWCPHCALNARVVFNDVLLAAASRKGACLSVESEFSNVRSKLEWKCAEDHRWSAPYKAIQAGKWCPACAKNQPPSYERIQEKAKEKGGYCLSSKDEYKTSSTKLLWQCGNGHPPWRTSWANIRNDTWCPSCANKAEAYVRRFLEVSFGVQLPSASPAWLKTSPKHKGFVLDGFNNQHSLAFEYHGAQHFKHVPSFHRNGKSLDLQQSRDSCVRQLCLDHGVVLLEIPYLPGNITALEVVQHCLPYVEPLLGSIPDEKIKEFLDEPFGISGLSKLHEFAREKNGKCLATQYIGAVAKYQFQCNLGHTWSASWHSIKKGSWCPGCARRAKPTLLLLQAFAENLGGQCLATVYINNKTPIAWRCKHGHEWAARWNNISNGGWCPKCRTKTSP